MNSFVAIDVETANGNRSSICSIGAVKVCDGVVVDSRYSLVRPEPNWYSYYCTQIHGLSDDDTHTAPTFGEVWPDFVDWINGLPLVAHNAVFDSGCIREACRVYRLEPPEQEFLCTLKAARKTIPRQLCPSKSLDSLCQYFGIPLKHHHNALDDAEAAAKLAVVLLSAD